MKDTPIENLLHEELVKAYKKLEIRIDQQKNELFLIKQENDENAAKYVDLMNQISSKNEELEHLKNNLEKIVDLKTAELRENTKELKLRDRLMEAASEISTSLMGTIEDIETAIVRSFRLIGETYDVNRVYIFENHGDPETGALMMKLKHEWTKHGTSPLFHENEINKVIYKKTLPRWYTELSKGEAIYGIVEQFPENERQLFQKYDTISMLVTPITLRGVFWGLIGLDDCEKQRFWNHNEVSILSALGSAIAGRIFREKTRKELTEAKKKAEAATEAKSEFLANMSHEIRTPLNGVIGIIELLSRTELTVQQKEYISDLKYSSDMLMSIINNILDISKIEAGRLEIENEAFSLRKMLNEIYHVMKHKAAEKGIELRLQIAEEVPEAAAGDMYRIRQVLLNLVSNALKFTAEGFIEITVDLREKANEKLGFLFKVTDTGTGIPESKIPNLFKKFSQADTSITRKFGGTGLGLAICKLLLEKMGGKIYVKSQEGEGSSFSFTIHLDAVENFLDSSDQTEAIEWKRIPKALIVDDNQINRKISAATVESLGILTETAENGLEAVNKYKINDYDIVFMDVHMPVMDGIEATKVIKKIGKASGPVPVIALTASAMDAGRKRCIDAGMDEYLAKPIEKNKLVDIIKIKLAELISKCTYRQQENTPAAKEYSIFSKDKALSLMDDNPALLKELLEYFLKSTPGMIDELHNHLQEGKLQEAEIVAHTMKGMGRNLALEELGEISYRIEKSCSSHDKLAAEELFKLLPETFDRAADAVRKCLA